MIARGSAVLAALSDDALFTSTRQPTRYSIMGKLGEIETEKRLRPKLHSNEFCLKLICGPAKKVADAFAKRNTHDGEEGAYLVLLAAPCIY